MGWHERMPLELFWALSVAVVGLFGWTLWRGVRQFRWPSRAEAVERVDSRLPGRPLAALADSQAVGTADGASAGVWRIHLARMLERSRAAAPVQPDLKISAFDRIGLRYMALIAFAAALLFGSIWRVGSVAEMAPGAGERVLAAGPVWEGWVEPPSYTAKPSLYLNDIPAGPLRVPEGSEVTLRLYGEMGALRVAETVSGQPAPEPVEDGPDPRTLPEQSFEVAESGQIAVEGPGGVIWEVTVTPMPRPRSRLSARSRSSAGRDEPELSRNR